MPAKNRVQGIDFAELELRAKWGGCADLPELTDEERRALQAHREASDTWLPRAALAFCWANVDPIHGGGEWSWPGFLAALQTDQHEIARVTQAHPEQAARLHEWVEEITALGRERESDR